MVVIYFYSVLWVSVTKMMNNLDSSLCLIMDYSPSLSGLLAFVNIVPGLVCSVFPHFQ